MYKNKFLPLLLPFRCIAFVLIFVIGAAVTGKEVGDISNWWTVAASVLNIVTIGIILLAAKKCGTGYKELMNLKKQERSKKKTVLLVIGFIMAGTVGMYLAGFICYGVIPYSSPVMIRPIPVVLAIVNFFVLPLTVPFAEDGLYLGCGTAQIKNKYAAVIVPAFFFALQHSFIPMAFDFRYIIYRFLSFLPLTVIFCIYFQKKRDPLPIMAAHAILDLATVVLVLVTSVSPEIYDKLLSMQ